MSFKRNKNLEYNNLKRKYQNLFINELEFENMEYGVADFMMKQLLLTGQVAAFNLKTDIDDYRLLGFGQFTGVKNDWKGDPISVRIINAYNNDLIPKEELINNEEAVILYLGFNPSSFINEYVIRIMEVRSVINTNLNSHKMPFVVKSSDLKTIRAIQKLLDGEEVVSVTDHEFEVINANTPYIIDKLTLYLSEVEAELLSIIGIDNVKFEKKAQMTVDEVNSNNDEIDSYRKMIRNRVEQFVEQINNVLGHNIILKKENDQLIEEEGEENEV